MLISDHYPVVPRLKKHCLPEETTCAVQSVQTVTAPMRSGFGCYLTTSHMQDNNERKMTREHLSEKNYIRKRDIPNVKMPLTAAMSHFTH